MIEATVAMAAMAGLFVAFGLMRIPDRAGGHGCGHGCDAEGGCPGSACSGSGCGIEHELHDTGVSS